MKKISFLAGPSQRNSNISGILLLCALLIFLNGCTQLNSYYGEEGAETRSGYILNDSALEDNACTSGECTCFVCKNDTPTEDLEFFNDLASPFFDYTLEEGECKFLPCDEAEFTDGFESEPNMHPYFFMVGQGSNFAEWADANRYCNNSLRMAVKWLSSREGYDYPLPREDRARCILSLNAIPTYILYSEGTAISPQRASQIAQTFVESGPVILVSEMDFDPNDNVQFTAAVAQVKQMKASCPKCLIAIAPRFYYNETFGYAPSYEAIDAIFAEPGAAESIDIVAVGVNSHNAKGCTSAEMLNDALNYSRYILETHKKPTLWAYVLFDQDWNAGGEEYGTCKWSEGEVTKGYSDLFKYSPALAQAGVMGMAPYSLYGIQNGPINCTDCAMMSVDKVRYPSHTTWFSLCQKYYTYRGAIPIVFTSEPGTDCSFANNFNLYQLEGYRMGSSPTVEDLEGMEVEPSEIFPRCNGQLLSELPEEIESIPTFSLGSNDEKCEIHPMLDFYADIRDMDPALTRAFAWAETGLDNPEQGPGGDTCVVSRVKKSEFPNLPTEVPDPEGICPTAYATESCPYSGGCTLHSIGVMGVHMYPAEMWDDSPYYRVEDYEDDALWCAGESFNPFNEAHNACLGTAILGSKIDSAMGRIASNEAKLGLAALKEEFGENSDKYQNMKGALTIFAAAYRYNGYTGYLNNEQAWINEFGNQRVMDEDYCEGHPGTLCCDDDGDVISSGCCGQTNFIDFVKNCHNPSNQYAFQVLGRYNALIDDCDKYNEQAWYQNVIDYLQSYYQEEPAEAET